MLLLVGHFYSAGDSAHQLTGKGPVMYEEITRIPLIIHQRGKNSLQNVSCDELASHVDIVPTLLELAGIPCPNSLDGQSLCPVLNGEPMSPDKSVVIEFDRFEISNDSLGGFFLIRTLRKGKWKLVINLLDTDELYDLEADPAELRNLIDDMRSAGTRNELHDELLTWMYEHRDPFRSPAWERRPWREHRIYG